ncbi:MAG: HPr family phosphocarrier protein [Treponema sp.]|jgi:phosphocarrier protein|nr:HPr family phosphocarrier protein [Treponema sp.]
MYAKKTVIINKSGIHARPGSRFVREAKKFVSDITISKLDAEDKPVKSCPAKSIVQVMAMMLSRGTRVELSAEGEDEQNAVDSLVALIDSGLNDL